MTIKELKNTPESIEEYCAYRFNLMKQIGRPYDTEAKKAIRKFVSNTAKYLEALRKMRIDI